MKRFTILALITIGTILPANAILENVTNPEQSPIKVSVWCTPNRKMCKIGKYTLKTTTEEPLYIKENLVCTPDKKCAQTVQNLYAHQNHCFKNTSTKRIILNS